MTQTFDVIIIGAGIAGCSTAYQLAQRGLNVAVLEKDGIATGSTGKSSAIIRQHYSNELTARMALHSLRVFQNFPDQLGEDCGFTPTGFVALASAKDQAGLEANVALQRGVGIQTELISPEALKEVAPGMVTSDLVAAAYEPESGYADPYLTTMGYANAARRLGAKILVDTPVTGIRLTSGKVVGVDTPNEPFDAPLVLNCAGPWGARVARLAGVEVPINACRVQVALFHRPADYAAPHPVVADFIHAFYARSETGDHTLLGLIDPAEANAIVNPDEFNEQVDFEFINDGGERLIRRFSYMEQSHSTGGYSSLYAITPDWHPIVDELLPASGLFICTGFSGHGFKLGPAVGVMAADMVTGASDPEFDPHLFRLNRYADDDPVRGKYEYSIAG